VFKKLYKLVLGTFIGPFILTFFIVIFVLLMQFLWKYIDELVGKGLETEIIAELLLYTSASLVPMALPLAVLLSSIMTFGNLAEHNELLAFKTAGVPLQTIMRPIIIFSCVITVFAFLFSNNVLPYANLQMRSLLYDIQRQNPELQIKTGVFDNTLEGYSIRIEHRDPRTNLLKDIRIYDHTGQQGNTTVTLADSGYMQMTADERNLIITLYNGFTYIEMQKDRRVRRDKSYPARRDRFEEQQMIIELKDFGLQRTDQNLFKSSFHMMNLSQLMYVEDSLINQILLHHSNLYNVLQRTSYNTERIHMKRPHDKDTIKTDGQFLKLSLDSLFFNLPRDNQIQFVNDAISLARNTINNINTNFVSVDSQIRRLRRYQIEMHRKFTLSVACFFFFFIGAPLGAIIRKGGLGMPVVVSVVFFILYYIVSLMGEKFVRESVFSPFSGMWFSTFILIPISFFLTYKAATDSVIMHVDTYFKFFKKLLGKTD